MHTTLSWNTPHTRSDGTVLNASDIASITIKRNGTGLNVITGGSIAIGPMSYTDTNPNGPADTYTVEITATDGTSSGPSNAAAPVVAPTPTAVSDLMAALYA